ncbi:MAG: TonB-dependent siderophore receptor [Proteobacteria bacterium]|nr:TonB-dependent siderophore receptor [Pseudomonadota bacterium]
MQIPPSATIRHLAFLTLLAGISTAGPAFAQIVPDGAGTIAQAPATLPIVLPPVDVKTRSAPGGDGAVEGYNAGSSRTATKTDTPVRDTPQSISIMTKEFVDDVSAQSMQDAVRYVPGVTMHQGEGNRDQFIFRGNSSSADFFIDGVRDDVQYYRDLYNVDRIEVLKGPNAMIFGRGGAGGVINRAMKYADGNRVREISGTLGSFANRRVSVDIGDKISEKAAFRVNTFYQYADSFRNRVNSERSGINPTFTVMPSDATTIKFGFEYFKDNRTADRGLPSAAGRPYGGSITSFYGDPNVSYSNAVVKTVYATVEHETNIGINIRNNTRYSDYEKFYQNVYPGSALNATGTSFNLSAYNNSISRGNFTNQTDFTGTLETGPVVHRLLFGTEFSRQTSDTLRNSGFFNGTATTFAVSPGSPTVSAPVTFRHVATDAWGQSVATVAATYVQNQMEINRHLQLIGGLRFDQFDYDFIDKNTYIKYGRTDNLVSPRVGVVVKPVEPLSLYTSYSVSYLPASGDQFASLATNTQGLKPEQMTNYEAGAKWDVRPGLSLNAAVFQLDRENTRAVDPADTTRFVLTGQSRTRGTEIGATGKITEAWQVVGGYAYQDAYYVTTTSAARAGTAVALVPRHTATLWNKYQFTQMWAAGVGVIRQTEQFAAADNGVTLPGYTRADMAVYATIIESLRAQLYVENVTGAKYYLTADSNNNITPGSERAARFTITTKF